ncbi:hypothetical protein B7494_g7557 [Chlorociboria aeruginascens]|nr:hypothetical protein B7494_g7557 [Chlorociboria aeruginascens]
MHFSNIILPLLTTLSLAAPSSRNYQQQCVQSKFPSNVATTFNGPFFIIVRQYDTPVRVVDDPEGGGLPHSNTVLGAPGDRGTLLQLRNGELYYKDRVADHPVPEDPSLNPKVLVFRDSSRAIVSGQATRGWKIVDFVAGREHVQKARARLIPKLEAFTGAAMALLGLLVTVASLLLPHACAQGYTGGDTSGCGKTHFFSGITQYIGLTSSGVSRTYGIHLPSNYSETQQYPLIIGFHGSSSIGLFFEVDTLLDEAEYTGNKIMVYPDGLGGAWAGANYSTATVPEDLQFVWDMLASIRSNYCIDSARIYATGLSIGGGFVNTLACNDTVGGEFAAFAPAKFHGGADTDVLYAGGDGEGGYEPPIADWVGWWAERNGCDTPSAEEDTFDDDVHHLIYTCQGQYGAVQHYKTDDQILERVSKFNDHIQPYFDVLGIVVSAHPEYAAFAWGSIRLVLQLASNFITFFEKLGEILRTLCTVMPQFADILLLIDTEQSERLKLYIQQYYVDLFEFLKTVARVFTKKDGETRRSPFVVGQLMWQPFEARCGNLRKRFINQKQLIEDELRLFHLQQTMKISQSHEEERLKSAAYRKTHNNIYQSLLQESKQELDNNLLLHRVKKWLMAPEFRAEFEDAHDLREDGTGEWLLRESKFVSWRDNQAINNEGEFENTLWVKGNPGCGKTILAAAIVEALKSPRSPTPNKDPNVCYFFFTQKSSPQKIRPIDAYRSFIAQLLQQYQSEYWLLDACSYAMTDKNKGQDTASANDLLELLKLAFGLPGPFYLVLDGVDECSEPDSFLKKLFQVLGTSQAKVLIFSRPNVGFLGKRMALERSIPITRESSKHDLNLFFTVRIEELQDDDSLPSSVSCKQLVERLLQGADGMFLWARLMMSYLASDSHVPASRLRTIMALENPEHLDTMFDRILNLISKNSSNEQDLARRIFLWLIHSKVQLNEDQLKDVLNMSEVDASILQIIGDVDLKSLREFTNFEHTVVMACASLVERATSQGSSSPYYRFIHKAAIDYFTPTPTSSNTHQTTFARSNMSTSRLDPEIRCRFLPSQSMASVQLTKECLMYLINRAPASPLSGNMLVKANPRDVIKGFPFLSYASSFWSVHLSCTVSAFNYSRGQMDSLSHCLVVDMLSLLSKFLSAKLVLMAWVESFYIFAGISAPTQLVGNSSHNAFSIESELSIKNVHSHFREWSQVETLSFKLGEFQHLPSLLTIFGDDLATMHSLWWDTLMRSPEQIWNDITTFTPSRFFQTTSATSLKSLSTTKPSSSSDVPLCKISSDSLGGDELAVLSIWPSKQFEDEWRTQSAAGELKPNTSNPLINFNKGWIATYEIWNLEGEPRLQHSYRIPLDSTEVSLQLQGFLELKPSGINHDGWHAARWELHFPTSISSAANVFSVLRTIYVVNRESKTTSGTWRNFLLPLENQDPSLVTLPPGCRKYNWCEDQRRLREMRYIYKLQFSDNNRYLLYCDTLGPGFYMVTDKSPTWTNVAIFALNIHQPEANAKLIRKTSLMSSDAFFTDCSFHPGVPIVALSVFTIKQNTNTILFGFDLATSEDLYSIICTTEGKTESHNFSSCGTNIIVKKHGQFPKIFPITADRIYEMASEAANDSEVRDHNEELENSSNLPSNSMEGQTKELALRSVFQRSGMIQTLSDNRSATIVAAIKYKTSI